MIRLAHYMRPMLVPIGKSRLTIGEFTITRQFYEHALLQFFKPVEAEEIYAGWEQILFENKLFAIMRECLHYHRVGFILTGPRYLSSQSNIP